MLQNNIHISDSQMQVVKEILKQNFSNVTVWVFGSRVLENYKSYSDLDIALEFKDNNELKFKKIAASTSDFIDSDLPFKVDLVDYNSLGGIIKQNIDEAKIKLILD